MRTKEYRLGDIADVFTGFPFKGSDYSSLGIRVVRGENVTIGSLRWDTVKCWKGDFESKYSLRVGDIVIGMDGSRVGKNRAQIRQTDLPLLLAQRVACIRAVTGVSQDLLAYALKSPAFERYVTSIHTGTSIPHISQKQIEEFPITIPDDLPTQTAIAEILSSLDDKIELNNQINQNLEDLAQAIFKHWFVDFEFPNEKGQPYKSSGGEMVESELGKIPKNWSVSAFRDSVEVVRGLSYKGGGLVSEGEGVAMHNLNSVYEGGGYKYEGIKYYSGQYKEHHRIVPWDLIVTNTEQGHKYLLIGYPAFVPKAMGDSGIFSHHIYKVKALPNSGISNQFLLYLIMTPDVRDQIIGCANGTTVNMLKIDGLQRPKFVKPNKDTIDVFTNLICDIWEQLENNYLQNRNLAKLRDSLLPKLISGEITVGEKTKVMAS